MTECRVKGCVNPVVPGTVYCKYHLHGYTIWIKICLVFCLLLVISCTKEIPTPAVKQIDYSDLKEVRVNLTLDVGAPDEQAVRDSFNRVQKLYADIGIFLNLVNIEYALYQVSIPDRHWCNSKSAYEDYPRFSDADISLLILPDSWGRVGCANIGPWKPVGVSKNTSWIIAHEIGHILGAMHPEEGWWNGNMTRIQECNEIKERTIMSSCSGTIKKVYKFLPQVADTIYARIRWI